MGLKLVQFLALILTALALVPSGAHLFELPNKIGLAQEQYFTVQAIYRGWALFGAVLFPAVAANLLLAIMARRERRPFWLALTACLCLAGTLAIFLPGPIQPTRPPPTGPAFRRIGRHCGRTGNTRTPSMR